MASAIPIQNIYYLLIYAWDRLAEGELVDIAGLDSTELCDLYAAVLATGINHLLRRGLDQSYVPQEEELAGIRGRILIGVTARRMLGAHGRAYCQFDEWRVDTLPNQILRATVHYLIRAAKLDRGLREKLCGLDQALRGISEIRLSRQLFRKVQLHGNNAFYKFLLSLCELILESSIASEDAGSHRFRDFTRDQDRMAALFERFVFNFLRNERPEYDIRRERIYWAARSEDDPALSYLPTMQTDISVRRPERTLIIDTKFYQDTLQTNFGVRTVHSANLYQMFAYLKNLESRGGSDARAEGMLLYPVVQENVRLNYEIDGHRIRICTVDLGRPWADIREELLGLV